LNRKSFLALLALVGLVACTPAEQPEPIDVVSVKPPLVFTVSEIQFEEPLVPESGTGFRDRLRSERLADQTMVFLNDRLQQAGGAGWLQVVIEQARLVEMELDAPSGVRATFTREPNRVLDALLKVRLTVFGADGLEQAFTEAEVQRRRPILRNTSVIARDAEADRLIGDIIGQLDDELTQAAQQFLSAHLVL
jgi:hypothetical protein